MPAASIASPQDAPAETVVLSDFHARVGVQLAHLRSQERVSLAALNRQLIQRRGAQAPSKTASTQSSASLDDDDDLFESERTKLMSVLHRGGAGAMMDWLSRHDPLERYALLQHAMKDCGDGDKAALGNAMDGLMRQHGDALSTAIKDAGALRMAVTRMGALARANGTGGLHAARDLFNGGESGNLDGPTGALALAMRLQARFGTAHFSSALKEAGARVGAQMREWNATPGPKMWLSMSDAASFNAIQSAFAIGCELRRNLSDVRILARANEGEAVIALLGAACADDAAAKLADRIVGADGLSPKQTADMYRALTRAVESLPLILWTDDKLNARMDLIGELRSLGGTAAESVPKSRESQDARLERLLREAIAARAAQGDVGA